MGLVEDVVGSIPFVKTGVDIFNTWANFDQNQWQRSMQREAWNREDNAVQRRVNDLKRAGLSPVLAAGSAASSSNPISIAPPRAESSGLDAMAAAIQAKRAIKETQAIDSQVDLNEANAEVAKATKVAALAKVASEFQGIEESKSRTANNIVDKALKSFELLAHNYDFGIAQGLKTRYQGGGTAGKEIADAVNVTMEALKGGNVPGQLLGAAKNVLDKFLEGGFNPRINPKPQGMGDLRRLEAK